MAFDPDFNSVSLLLHCDGADASTSFTDKSNQNHTISVSGNAQVDTAQSQFGGASALFDGTTSLASLNFPINSSLDFGSGDFTVELWLRKNANNAGSSRLFQTLDGDIHSQLSFIVEADGDLGVFMSTTGTSWDFLDKPNLFNIANGGLFKHLAVVKSGTTVFLWVDGVDKSAGGWAVGTTPLKYLGTETVIIGGQTSGTNRTLDGWIDDVRVTKGVARYTTAFTPPTAPFPDAIGPALTGVSATSAVGSLFAPGQEPLTGVSVTSAAGSLGSAATVPLTGVSATSAVGSLVVDIPGQEPLTGVSVTSAAGSLGNAISVPLTGVSVTSAAGSLVAIARVRRERTISSPIIVSRGYTVTSPLIVNEGYAVTSPLLVNRGYAVTSFSRVDSSSAISYPIDGIVSAAKELNYDIDATTSVNAAKNISSPVIVSSRTGIQYDIDQVLNGSTSINYDISASVNVANIVDSEILAIDEVSRQYSVMSTIDDTSIIIFSQKPKLTINGKDIFILDGAVGTDEGSPFWDGTFTLPGQASFDEFSIDATFQCNIFGQIYEFIVDGKSKKMLEPSQVTFVLNAVSPLALLQKPRAAGVTTTYANIVLASTVVSDMLPGVTINWNILDWLIPAQRVSVENADPLEVAEDIAAAAGAILQSQPDGSVSVQYEFPTSPTAYASTVQDKAVSTNVEIFTLGQVDEVNEFFNRVEISDISPEDFSDSISHDDGVLKAFTKPYDDTVVIDHTSGTFVTLNRIGPVTEQIGATEDNEEIVEIRNGEGATQFPILSIDSFTYMEDNLGGLSFDPDTNTFKTATEGYSLVKIVYTTRYIKYLTSSAVDTEVQFVLKREVPETV